MRPRLETSWPFAFAHSRILASSSELPRFAAYRALLDAVGALVAAEGNALYAATERAVRGRVIFHAAAEDAHIAWDAAQKTAEALASV